MFCSVIFSLYFRSNIPFLILIGRFFCICASNRWAGDGMEPFRKRFLGLSGLYAAYSYQSKSIFPYLLGDVSLTLPIKFEIFNFDRFSAACLAPARPLIPCFRSPGSSQCTPPPVRSIHSARPLPQPIRSHSSNLPSAPCAPSSNPL